MTIDLVVFDMAGTTVHDKNEVQSCFEAALVKSGLEIPAERILALQGWSKRRVFQLLWTEHLGQGHPEIEKKVDETYALFREVLENHYKTHPVIPQPFAEDLFKNLKQKGIKIGLTTGFYREVTDLILQQLNWDKGLNSDYIAEGESIIDVSVCSDDVKNGRPAPDMIQLAMEKLDLKDPKRVINIGDTPSDLQSGKAADVGISLGVVNGTHSRDQLMVFENDGLLRDLSELTDYIDTQASIVV